MEDVIKLYEVEFNTYTTPVKNCVYNKRKDKYLSIMDTVIIKETDIMEAMDYGNGIKTLKCVGELRKL